MCVSFLPPPSPPLGCAADCSRKGVSGSGKALHAVTGEGRTVGKGKVAICERKREKEKTTSQKAQNLKMHSIEQLSLTTDQQRFKLLSTMMASSNCASLELETLRKLRFFRRSCGCSLRAAVNGAASSVCWWSGVERMRERVLLAAAQLARASPHGARTSSALTIRRVAVVCRCRSHIRIDNRIVCFPASRTHSSVHP